MGIPVAVKVEFGRSAVVVVALAAITVMQCLGVLTPQVIGLITVFTGGLVTVKTQEERRNGYDKKVLDAQKAGGVG